MSRTLADVEAYQVYRDGDGRHKWHDGVLVCIRADNGNIYTSDKSRADHIITGPCLGHVRDEPWRKADAKTVKDIADLRGSIWDILQRIAALEQRPSVPEGFVKNCIEADRDLAERYSGLAHRVGELEKKAKPADQCNTPPPAKPTQPPDVAVYTLTYDDGTFIEYRYPRTSSGFNRPICHGETRIVLDAFDRLGWDELRRWGLTLFGSAYKNDTWDVLRICGQTVSKHPTEREALTAARAIARKEGWR